MGNDVRERLANYNKLLAASGLSSLGDGLLVTGLPLLARNSTPSPLLVASVFSATRLPWLFGLYFGAIADRTDARRLMVAMDLVRGVCLAIVGGWLLAADRPVPIALLVLITLALTTGSILYFAASNRAIPALVNPDDFEKAYGRLSSVTTFGEQLAGPPIGAAVAATPSVPIVGDSISFLASAAILHTLPPIPAQRREQSVRQEISEGWQWFRSSGVVKLITFVMSTVSFASSLVLAIEVVLIKDTFKRSSFWFGAFTVVMALGALAGSSLAPRIIARLGTWTTPLAALTSGVALLACAGRRSLVFLFVAMFVQQAAILIALIATVAIRQRLIPSNLRGRVMTLSRSIAFAPQAVGGLLGGWLTRQQGTDGVLALAGGAVIVITLVTARPLRNAMERERV